MFFYSYWATLQYNSKFNPPGGFKGEFTRFDFNLFRIKASFVYNSGKLVNLRRVNTTSRFIIWGDSFKCNGKYQRGVCIFSFGDLSLLITRHEFFANKFLLDYNPIAYQCMEEWINNKNRYSSLNLNAYCHQPVLSIYNEHFYCDS